MKYVLCIDSGNPKAGCASPEKGIIYQLDTSFIREPLCIHNGRKSFMWYRIKGNPNLHSSLLFEDLPDDFLTELKGEVLKICNIKIRVWI